MMAPSAMPSLSFWFELASTYSYLTAVRIESEAARRGVVVEYRPFLLGPIFKDQGWSTSPFNIYEAKGRYMWRDIERTAERLGLPWRRPSVFPRNGLHGARLAVVAAEAGFAGRLVPELYRASFERDEDISSPQVLADILRDLGQDPEARLAEAGADRVKRALREHTDQARALGIFGSPSFVARGELYWGNDRLDEALTAAAEAPRGDGGSCGFPNDF
jgi:2-hydroxychromene-2-carboxylate isomerase